jgi:Periplasmic protein involved in polysaccharide export
MIKKLIFCFLVTFSFCFGTLKSQTNYILQRGDQLDISVMDHPEFTITGLLVLPDGLIQYPALGSVKVAGMSSYTLTDTLTKSLQKFVVNPIVTVYVQKIQKQQVNVFGFVNKPGQYQVFEPVDLLTTLSMAGGIKNLKRVSQVNIVRANGSMETVNLRVFFKTTKKISEKAPEVLLYPGDTVYVKEPIEFNWSLLSFITTLISSSAYTILILRK